MAARRARVSRCLRAEVGRLPAPLRVRACPRCTRRHAQSQDRRAQPLRRLHTRPHRSGGRRGQGVSGGAGSALQSGVHAHARARQGPERRRAADERECTAYHANPARSHTALRPAGGVRGRLRPASRLSHPRTRCSPSQCAALKTKRHNKILEQCLFPEILGKNIIFYEKVIYQ